MFEYTQEYLFVGFAVMLDALHQQVLFSGYLASHLHLPLQPQALLVTGALCEFTVDYLHAA